MEAFDKQTHFFDKYGNLKMEWGKCLFAQTTNG